MHPVGLSRREWLARCGVGMGLLGLTQLMGETGLLTAHATGPDPSNPLAPKIETISVVSPPDVPICGASRCKAGRLSASASCDASVSQ